MRSMILAAIAALALASSADAKSCHDASGKFVKCSTVAAPAATPAPASEPMEPSAPMASPVGHPHCTKGKPCGGSCIAMSKVCHKPG